MESQVKQEENEQQGHGNGHQEPIGSLLEVLKLTPIGKVIARGKLDLLEFLLYIAHYALNVSALYIEPYDDTALTCLTADLSRTQLILNRSDLAHGNLSVLCGHHHILHIVNSCTVEAIEAYH